jgi:hypothetical protein
VHGVLQKHYCCQRCAATCVVGELKTQLLLAQEQNAGLVSKRGQDSACEPIEDSSLHEGANGAKREFASRRIVSRDERAVHIKRGLPEVGCVEVWKLIGSNKRQGSFFAGDLHRSPPTEYT